MTIDARVLCQHMETAEASFQPALKLRHVVNVEKYSRSMKMGIDRMTYELNVVSARKKCALFQILSDFRMLRYLIGYDAHEFAALFNMCLSHLVIEFPRTPISCDDECVEVGVFRLSLNLIVFLTMMRCRHLNSFRFLTGFVGFSYGHLNEMMNRCEITMIKALHDGYLKKTIN